MSSIFENLSDSFYAAFFEPDSDKRRMAIDLWIESAIPALQSAVENEIRIYFESLLKDTWTTEGWKSRAKKFSGTYLSSRDKKLFIDTYKLSLGIKLENPDKRAQNLIIGPLTSETRTDTLNAIQNINFLINPEEKKKENPENTQPLNKINQECDDYDNEVNEQSPNDDRSDSMNPNNDSHQAAMDNHSNQMNPNNDAYWSSRGR
jgi:hypothetical protein